MNRPIRILLQTTIPETKDDWHIGRFSLLRDHLASLKDEAGNVLCQVTARNRESDAGGNDPVLSALDRSDFDELWLFAVDIGDGLTAGTVKASRAFVNAAEGFSPHATIRIWAHLSARWAASDALIFFTREILSPMNHGIQLTIP